MQQIKYSNINLFRKKFVFAENVIRFLDMFLVSQLKSDHEFLDDHFRINGYKTF